MKSSSHVVLPSAQEKKKKIKECASRRQFFKKPSIIPGCPGSLRKMYSAAKMEVHEPDTENPLHCMSMCHQRQLMSSCSWGSGLTLKILLSCTSIGEQNMKLCIHTL